MILRGTSKAKASIWVMTDVKPRKVGEQNRLETEVVLPVNDAN